MDSAYISVTRSVRRVIVLFYSTEAPWHASLLRALGKNLIQCLGGSWLLFLSMIRCGERLSLNVEEHPLSVPDKNSRLFVCRVAPILISTIEKSYSFWKYCIDGGMNFFILYKS
jgi:hypothetical protein